MKIGLALYNFLIIMLFAIALAGSFLTYNKTKKNIYIAIAVMFIFYILDNTLIYLTEFFDSFAVQHDNLLVHVPSFKIIIFTVTNVCWMYTNQIIIDDDVNIKHYFWVIVCAVFSSLVPFFSDGAMEIWLFFTPSQVFLFALALYGLVKMKKYPERYIAPIYKSYKKLILVTMIFCILIVVEDTIVIFNFDVYEDFMVKVHNRSLTDDILSIIYAVAFIRLFLKYNLDIESIPIAKGASEDFLPPLSKEIPNRNVSETKTWVECDDSNDNNLAIDKFCNKYMLTERERELLKLILQNKSNQDISDELFISIGTVKTHIHNIYSKVDVTKRNSLIAKFNEFMEEK